MKGEPTFWMRAVHSDCNLHNSHVQRQMCRFMAWRRPHLTFPCRGLILRQIWEVKAYTCHKSQAIPCLQMDGL